MNEMTQTMTSLHGYFGYRDAGAAIEWLGRAFGFRTTMRFPDDQGGVAHAELRLGDAVVIVFSDHDGYERAPRKGVTTGQGLYMCLARPEDVDAVHADAVVAGGTVVWEPAWTEWGNYSLRVVDPEGFEWSFGVHRPGVPVED